MSSLKFFAPCAQQQFGLIFPYLSCTPQSPTFPFSRKEKESDPKKGDVLFLLQFCVCGPLLSSGFFDPPPTKKQKPGENNSFKKRKCRPVLNFLCFLLWRINFAIKFVFRLRGLIGTSTGTSKKDDKYCTVQRETSQIKKKIRKRTLWMPTHLAVPGGELGEVEVGPDCLQQGQAVHSCTPTTVTDWVYSNLCTAAKKKLFNFRAFFLISAFPTPYKSSTKNSKKIKFN